MISLFYKMNKNDNLFKDFENIGINNNQNFNPLYTKFFDLNENNFNSINLNNYYRLERIHEKIDRNKYKCTIQSNNNTQKNNTFLRPWGGYTNLFKGNNFLIKELFIKPKGILSLQKHFHRSEHWVITQGNPKIVLNKKFFLKKKYETIFIPKGAIHRIQNPNKKLAKVMEAQLGSTLKESDIVRFEDVYGRVS